VKTMIHMTPAWLYKGKCCSKRFHRLRTMENGGDWGSLGCNWGALVYWGACGRWEFCLNRKPFPSVELPWRETRLQLGPLGRVRLADLRRSDLQNFADGLLVDGLSPSYIGTTLLPLRAIVRRAMARDELAANS
jgi:hypothetical protein